jgi:hypothetical protein
MEAAKPTVQTIRQVNTFSAAGQLQPSYTVAFMVGEQGPFTVQIPFGQFNAANVQAAMQKVADEINSLTTGA